MRDFSRVPALHNANDLLAFMREAPKDRVLIHGSDLDPSEFEDSYSTRAVDGVLVVCSMKAVGASNISELVHAIRKQEHLYGSYKWEVAIIGEGQARYSTSRMYQRTLGRRRNQSRGQATCLVWLRGHSRAD